MHVKEIASKELYPESLKRERSVLREEDFYKLLITQLQNQDPLDPLKPDQFVAQLAQFAELETVRGVKVQLENSVNYLTSLNNLLSSSLIGKVVRVSGEHVYWNGSDPVPLGFRLDEGAGEVTLKIYSLDGSLVRTIHVEDASAGYGEVFWDGKDDEGRVLPSGSYRFSVSAVSDSGEPVPCEGLQEGEVERLEFDGSGVAYITLKGLEGKFTLSDILSVESKTYEEEDNTI